LHRSTRSIRFPSPNGTNNNNYNIEQVYATANCTLFEISTLRFNSHRQSSRLATSTNSSLPRQHSIEHQQLITAAQLKPGSRYDRHVTSLTCEYFIDCHYFQFSSYSTSLPSSLFLLQTNLDSVINPSSLLTTTSTLITTTRLLHITKSQHHSQSTTRHQHGLFQEEILRRHGRRYHHQSAISDILRCQQLGSTRQFQQRLKSDCDQALCAFRKRRYNPQKSLGKGKGLSTSS
jgi:hypothetical protein